MKENEESHSQLLQQWQTCVEMANSVSQRRDNMNNLFVSLNLAITAAVSFTWDMKSLFILTAGIVLCFLWLRFIRTYRLLNRAKFDVIDEIEKQLPSQPFYREWTLLKANKNYKNATVLERVLPITFIVLYAAAFIIILINKIKTGGCVQ